MTASPPSLPGPPAEEPVCPCDVFTHPRTITNPPARDTIDYRIGDYLSFRHALMLSLTGEAELSTPAGPIWRPAPGDLGLQMAEWWALCADVLTFYNQRIATQTYLRTADRPESVQRLIRLLGYRPRPGIGAHGLLAAVTGGTAPVTIPAGFPVQSKPGPGKQPQTFETDTVTQLMPSAAISADPVPSGNLAGADGQSLLLAGRIISLKPGDTLLLLPRGWAGGTNTSYRFVTVKNVAPARDPRGHQQTQVNLTAPLTLPAGAQAADYRLLKSDQNARIWPHATGSFDVLKLNSAALDSAVRGIQIGDPVLFDVAPTPPPQQPILATGSAIATLIATALMMAYLGMADPTLDQIRSGALHINSIQTGGAVSADKIALVDPASLILANPPAPTLVSVSSYTEAVWYVLADLGNPPNPAKPDPTLPSTVVPVGLLRSEIGFTPALTGDLPLWNLNKSQVTVRFGWREVAPLVAPPPRSTSGTDGAVAAAGGAVFPVGTYPVLLEGADGRGASATATVLASAPSVMQLTDLPVPPVPLTAPVTVLTGLLPVSRGKTVAREVLGSGNPAIAGQSFTLQNAPLTYLQSATATSGDNYSSTLTVAVDNIAWTEVPSFYGQPADARIFVTREDDGGKTRVLFGDGIHGARLPSGVNNVVARYRFGSGAEVPASGTLTVLAKPWPGLRAVRNPVAVGGGADPDPPDRIRQDAPRSVLTFGRAVSLDDHAAIALAAPGVARAKAEWVFDSTIQQAVVAVWVGDDSAARDAAQAALDAAIDPNRPVRVRLAVPTAVTLTATVVIDPRYVDFEPVLAVVRAALIDPATGLFGAARMGIGQSVYDSRIYQACLAVAGVRAVRDLDVTTAPCGEAAAPAMLATALPKMALKKSFWLPVLHPDTGIIGPLIPGLDPSACTPGAGMIPALAGF